MSGKIRVRVNAEIPGYVPGSVISLDADEEGTPLELYWRRRLKDAEVDGCCEIVEDAPPARPEPEEIEDDDEPLSILD